MMWTLLALSLIWMPAHTINHVHIPAGYQVTDRSVSTPIGTYDLDTCQTLMQMALDKREKNKTYICDTVWHADATPLPPLPRGM